MRKKKSIMKNGRLFMVIFFSLFFLKLFGGKILRGYFLYLFFLEREPTVF